MKIGHVILVLSGLVILGASLTFVIGRSDAPTRMTNADALAEQVFDASLPVLATPPSRPDDRAEVYYERVIELIQANRDALPKTKKHDELVDQVCEQLVLAAEAGRVADGFLDGHIPVQIGALPDYDDALEEVLTLAIYRSADLYRQGDTDQARALAFSVWVMGRRMFEHNVRLYHRNTGLDMMESAGSILYDMAENDPGLDAEGIRAWSDAIDGIRRHWQPKLQIILGTDPAIGDLVNIASHDWDRMFRIETTLRLGIYKHGSIGRGNKRAVERAIQDAMEQTDDPVLAEAARAADAMTLKERRRVY